MAAYFWVTDDIGSTGGDSVMDAVFRALADPSRRALLDSLNADNGQTLRELCAGLAMARQSVSKHLAVLEEAGLVVTVRRGREKLHYLNAAPVHEIAHRWISRYDRARVQALADLKLALEETPLDAPTFVYTTYIRATPEKLWQALTEPTFTRQYWATELATDWSVGSQMTWNNHGVEISDPEQVVLEFVPYSRLSYTWHTVTPELAERFGFDDELFGRLSGERRSRVTFVIEDTAPVVKLTVVHDGFEPGSTMAEMAGEGWPSVVASLKSLLETGDALPDDA